MKKDNSWETARTVIFFSMGLCIYSLSEWTRVDGSFQTHTDTSYNLQPSPSTLKVMSFTWQIKSTIGFFSKNPAHCLLHKETTSLRHSGYAVGYHYPSSDYAQFNQRMYKHFSCSCFSEPFIITVLEFLKPFMKCLNLLKHWEINLSICFRVHLVCSEAQALVN